MGIKILHNSLLVCLLEHFPLFYITRCLKRTSIDENSVRIYICKRKDVAHKFVTFLVVCVSVLPGSLPELNGRSFDCILGLVIIEFI